MNRILTSRRFFSPATFKSLQNVQTCSLSSVPVENAKTPLKVNTDIGIPSQDPPSIKKLIDQIDPLPLAKQKKSSLFSETIEVSKDVLKVEAPLEKTPLPFEEVPSPVILRIWEKYWKYVPLLGTQLFCSLLINGFTQGRLSWGRNMNFLMPMKFLFDEYGPVVRIHGALMNDVVLIHRPEHIAEVLKQENESPIRSGFDTLHHYRINLRKYKLPGLFSMREPEWSELRKKIDKPLNEEIYKMIEKVGIACEELVQRIDTIKNRQDEVPAEFMDELNRWGVECFAILMLDRKLGFLEPSGYNASSEQIKLTEALTQAQKYMSICESGFQVWRFVDTPFSKKLFSACDVIDGFVNKYIRQAEIRLRDNIAEKKAIKDCSIVEQLLFKQQLQPEDVSTLLMDSLLLGTLATVNTEAFLLYSIAKNPRIQNKIHEEIIAVAPDARSVTKEKLNKMTYLKACLKECLRLYPAFPYISRVLQNPIVLHGYSIPKGAYVIMANDISSRREENFEDPEKFNPERWLAPGGKLGHQQEYSCLPFGHGIRSCVGKSMAEMEILLLTSTILRKYKLEYDYANIRGKYLMVNVPNKPLRFRFVERNIK